MGVCDVLARLTCTGTLDRCSQGKISLAILSRPAAHDVAERGPLTIRQPNIHLAQSHPRAVIDSPRAERSPPRPFRL